MRETRARGWRAQLTLLTAAVLAIALLQATARPIDNRVAATPGPEAVDAAIVAGPPTAVAPAVSGSNPASIVATIGAGVASTLDLAAGLTNQTTSSGPDRTPPAAESAVYSSTDITVISDVRYASRELLDIYVPNGPGPHPTVVLIRGGPSGDGGRAYLDSFAGGLASVGLLVFNADYRDGGDGVISNGDTQ